MTEIKPIDPLPNTTTHYYLDGVPLLVYMQGEHMVKEVIDKGEWKARIKEILAAPTTTSNVGAYVLLMGDKGMECTYRIAQRWGTKYEYMT